MVTLLNQYHEFRQFEDAANELNTLNVTRVLDNFHHIVLQHDSDEAFNEIYARLEQHCDGTDCKHYARYYRRRRERGRVDQREEKSGEASCSSVARPAGA